MHPVALPALPAGLLAVERSVPVFTGCEHLPSSGHFCKNLAKASPSVVAEEHVLGPNSRP